MFFSWIERYHISDARSRFRPRDNIEPVKREPRRAPQGFSLPALGWKVTNPSTNHRQIFKHSNKIRTKSVQNHPKSIQNRCLEKAGPNGSRKLAFWRDFGFHVGSPFVSFSLKNHFVYPNGTHMEPKIRKTSKTGRQKTMPKRRRQLLQPLSK